jgi:mono/diheme cytochrome c family protein
MRRGRIVGLAAVAVGVAGLAVAIGGGTARARESRLEKSRGRAGRGKYLVDAMGCSSCHTPKTRGPRGPVEDRTRYLSGHPGEAALPPPPALGGGGWDSAGSWDVTAWSGPWGVSYSMNLTPDENTGIGSWSEDIFVAALKTGRHMGVSRPILPPMPWGSFRNLADEDLRSIYAYLRTIPPVPNRVPDPLPPAESPPAGSTSAPGEGPAR